MKERLELVTDFASLRAGMMVVVRGCGRCRRDHRGCLLNFEKGSACMATNGTVTTEDTWEVIPCGACGCAFIGRYDVEHHRCVYRVVDEQLDSEQRAQRRSREQPKKKQVRA